MPTTNTNTSAAKRLEEDYGISPVTAEELQSRFDAVTRAEYDRQRTDLQTATNQYYNQLYTTQNTAMDTIRQANAQAVASGASKGVQAANELSAILGLQSESATGAAELANQATMLAQDETTAMLENMLNAQTQAAEQNQALAQLGIQLESVDVERQNAETARAQSFATIMTAVEQIKQTNPELAASLESLAMQYAPTSSGGTGNSSSGTEIPSTGTPTSPDTSNSIVGQQTVYDEYINYFTDINSSSEARAAWVGVIEPYLKAQGLDDPKTLEDYQRVNAILKQYYEQIIRL